MDTFTSFLAGITIFSILGNLAHESGKNVSDVVSAGTGLAFVSYPDAIAKFEYVPQVKFNVFIFGKDFFKAKFFTFLVFLRHVFLDVTHARYRIGRFINWMCCYNHLR